MNNLSISYENITKNSFISDMPFPIEDLPNEILFYMFTSSLDTKSLGTSCRVCKKWKILNQSFINNISIVISLFIKSIPTFIGYDKTTITKVQNWEKEKHPEISECIKTHTTEFKGFISGEERSLVPIARPDNIKAVALEFEEDKIDRTLMRKSFSLVSKVSFVVELYWKQIPSNYDGNYSQDRFFPDAPICFDIHTHSPFVLYHYKITSFEGTDLSEQIFNLAIKFLNQRSIHSETYKPDFIYLNGGRIANARIWSKTLLKEKYTYI